MAKVTCDLAFFKENTQKIQKYENISMLRAMSCESILLKGFIDSSMLFYF
jgi:hypothetical protein